ncbi:MAG: pyruvate formate lyase family protein, partial [Firmicutes bacterium]|nr:pyruvate formate lyase family protein [Bacillota bacterium]
MTERVRKLRETSLNTTPTISMERARYFTEAYKKWSGSVSVPEMRALALKYFMENRSLYIEEGELIVGEKGEFPQSAPTFPELCCHTVEDLEIMNDREVIFFKNTEEQRNWHRDNIIPYWENRSIRKRILDAMSPEWKDAYAAGIFTEFMEQRGPGHTVCSDKIYSKGFSDYKRDIEEAISKLDYQNDPLAYRRREELSGMSIACDAIITLGHRYSDLARQLAASEENEARKSELLTIAENCSVVPEFAPKTFHQALQMYWFVHLAVTTEIN